MVLEFGKEADIDRSYYDTLVDEALLNYIRIAETLNGFVSDEPCVGPNFVVEKPLYFDDSNLLKGEENDHVI